ncbi:MAG: hypothetical protein LUM44_21020 [Pyrinomonadaceae bacterium]|nr:hypothetical protein [Pyrinomonadaceae bacterium]
MYILRKDTLPFLVAILVAVFIFNSDVYSQLTINIGTTANPVEKAPTGYFTVTGTLSTTNNVNKIVFFRNDVPYQSFSGSNSQPYIEQNNLGQDTYTYRVRAILSNGDWVDSDELKVTVESKNFIWMGMPVPTGTPTSPIPPATNGPVGPSSTYDHTNDVINAITYLTAKGGGTLYFPCNGGSSNSHLSIYNISDTINIPSNITLQGESAEEGIYAGDCRIYWTTNPVVGGCPNTLPGAAKTMFDVTRSTTGVRFKDLWLVSRILGRDCGSNGSPENIRDQQTTAIALAAASNGHIHDVILENVSITGFTHGISATGYSISDVKIRGLRPLENHRQLYINTTYAYDWDIQNFNFTGMLQGQGGVEIVRAGVPSGYTGINPNLKFLQLNCNGNTNRATPPAFCVQVTRHGGLYFKQLHHEGVPNAIIVENIAPDTNSEPIIFENSVATGEFKDPSMKLYLLGNGVFAAPKIAPPGLDNGRLRFNEAGVNSTLVDCGDAHGDWTDVGGTNPTHPPYSDLWMLFTHTERNRESFFGKVTSGSGFIEFPKKHTVCPQGVSGQPNVTDIGGYTFNSGVMPTEAGIPYSKILNQSKCPNPTDCATNLQLLLNSPNNNHGTVLIDGVLTVDRTITIPSGRQIVGAPGAKLILDLPGNTTLGYNQLFRIDLPVNQGTTARLSGVTIRNLHMMTADPDAVGLALIGEQNAAAATSSDMHFSGLTFEGFTKGIEVKRFPAVGTTTYGEPMVDGVSWKRIRFVNNQTAARIYSSNVSNWNVMNLYMEANTQDAFGWHQTTSGTSMQNVDCRGNDGKIMLHCIKLDMSATYLTGFKQNQYVKNAITFGENGTVFSGIYQSPQFGNTFLRDNDFRSSGSDTGRVNLIGKTFITSINNKYKNFYVDQGVYQGNVSRLTYCGDTYPNNAVYPGLADDHQNFYVGVPTPTRISCGERPKPWEDVINFGGQDGDIPLTANILDDVREDMVIYRPAANSQFMISKTDGTYSESIGFGTTGDIPMFGKILSTSPRSQMVVYRPSTREWKVRERTSSTEYTWIWGLACTTSSPNCDVPFIGNFFDNDNFDEIGIYRPTDKTMWILNPRTGTYYVFGRVNDYGSTILIGDFLGAGYEQVGQYSNGVWTILDPRTNANYTVNHGAPGDVPVAGKYLPGNCTQVAFWNPVKQQISVKDPFTSCGTRTKFLTWGTNNEFGTGLYYQEKYDIPLTIKTPDGTIDRPVAYRRSFGPFQQSMAKGQWWIHDKIVP